jgi:hypothetical protein
MPITFSALQQLLPKEFFFFFLANLGFLTAEASMFKLREKIAFVCRIMQHDTRVEYEALFGLGGCRYFFFFLEC